MDNLPIGEPSFKFVAKVPAPFVSMVVFEGVLYVATTERVYKLVGDKLVPLAFQPA